MQNEFSIQVNAAHARAAISLALHDGQRNYGHHKETAMGFLRKLPLVMVAEIFNEMLPEDLKNEWTKDLQMEMVKHGKSD